MKRIAHLFLSLLLVLAPALVAAETVSPAGYNAWTLYVFGNGDVIWNILNAISAMVQDDGYRNLLSMIATIGVIVLGARSGFDTKQAPKLIGYFAGAYFAMYALLSLEANIEVNDPVTGYANVATGVPAAVGIPAAVISNIGHWMTEKVEQNFSIAGLPNNLSISGGGGFDMANSLARDAAQVQIIDPYLRQSTSRYMVDCVMPMIVSGAVSSHDLINSSNLWATIANPNPGIMTQYFSGPGATGGACPNGCLMTCPDAYTAVKNQLDAQAPELVAAAGSAWYANRSFSFMSGAVQSAYTWLSDGAMNGSAASTVQQAAAIHVMTDSFGQAAAMTGNNELVMSISMAQARQSQKSQWFSAAQLFKDMVGYIYSILQAFIFAVVPILIVAILVPGFGGVILKNYGQVLIWLVLWEPLLAVINFIVALYAQQGMMGSLSYHSGLSLANMPTVTEQTSHFMTAAGFMATMVPMISWGLVKGAMAFTEFISAGIGSSFASGAATGMASGNVSLDSQSMGSKSFGQENFKPMASVGYGQTNAFYSGVGALEAFDGGGRVLMAHGKTVDDSRTTADGVSHTQGAGTSMTQQQAYEHARASTASQILTDMQSVGSSVGSRNSAGASSEHGSGATVSTKAAEDFSTGVKAIMAQVGSKEDASVAALAIGAKLAGDAKKAGVNLNDTQSAATQGFLSKAVGSAWESVKNNPVEAAALAAGVLLAIPSGGASLAAAGTYAAARAAPAIANAFKNVGLKEMAGNAAAMAGAAGLAGSLSGNAQTNTTWKTNEQATRNTDSEHDLSFGKDYAAQLSEKQLESLARMAEKSAQATQGTQFASSTGISEGYAEKMMAAYQQQATENWQRSQSETDSASHARDATRNDGYNPTRTLERLYGEGPSALRTDVDNRVGRITAASEGAFGALASEATGAIGGSGATINAGRSGMDTSAAQLDAGYDAAAESARQGNGARTQVQAAQGEIAEDVNAAGSAVMQSTGDRMEKSRDMSQPFEAASNWVSGSESPQGPVNFTEQELTVPAGYMAPGGPSSKSAEPASAADQLAQDFGMGANFDGLLNGEASRR